MAKRKWTALCLVLLCLWAGSALALSQQEALDKAYAWIKTYLHHDESALTFHQSGRDWDTSQGNWRFSFLLKQHAPDNNGLVLVDMAPDGSLLSIQGPSPLSDEEQLANAVQDLAQPITSASLLTLQAQWAHRLPRMMASMEADEARYAPSMRPHRFYYQSARALTFDIQLPGEGALPLDEAAEKARQYAISQPGWSQAGLDMMELTMALYYHSPAFERPVWHLAYSQHSVHNPLYSGDWERYERLYLKPLYKLFGGDNRSTPWYISLLLDGHTGQLLEPPATPYPGLENIPLAFSQMK